MENIEIRYENIVKLCVIIDCEIPLEVGQVAVINSLLSKAVTAYLS